MGNLEGANARCFVGTANSTEDLKEKEKFLVASWMFFLPQFCELSKPLILRNWEEVAFSFPRRSILSIRCRTPPPKGSSKLNFDSSTIGNLGSACIGGVLCNSDPNF